MAHRDAALPAVRRIEAAGARAGEAQELEIGQTLEQRARKGGALAHQAQDRERRELARRFLLGGEGLVEDADLDTFQAAPVGRLERDALVVVEDRQLHSTRMLLSLTTLPQRSISLRIHFCVSSGPSATTSMPCVSVRILFTSG